MGCGGGEAAAAPPSLSKSAVIPTGTSIASEVEGSADKRNALGKNNKVMRLCFVGIAPPMPLRLFCY
jgi:hypothetical protein